MHGSKPNVNLTEIAAAVKWRVLYLRAKWAEELRRSRDSPPTLAEDRGTAL